MRLRHSTCINVSGLIYDTYWVYTLGVYCVSSKLALGTPVICLRGDIQPIAFGVSFDLILQSQSNWSLFNGTWQKRHQELDNRLRFEFREITLQMHEANIYWQGYIYWHSRDLDLCISIYMYYIFIYIYVYIYICIYIY